MASTRLFAVVLVSISLLASAEIQAADSADCAGAVVDENSVTVGAGQLRFKYSAGKVYRTETDGAGRFVLQNLPAGDYKVEVRKEGFFLLSGQSFSLHACHNELTLTLNHVQELHEQVQVTAPSNQIDTQDTSQRSSLSSQNIRDIPVPNSHVLAASLVALPEIVRDSRSNLHIAGARSGETQYLLDGFAHSGAGILSLETPDGEDRWRFGTTNPAPGINIQEGAHLGNWYPRGTFSRPIVRGHFWFSDAISIQHTFDVVKQLPSNANTSEQWAGDNLLRLQYNLSPRHILHASFLYNRAYAANLGLDALDPQSTTVTIEHRRAFVSLKDQLWLHDTLFELGVAADSGVLDYTPQGTQPYVLLINGTTGNYFQRLHQRGRRLQAFGSVTAASRHWHGTHQLAAGANLAGVLYSQSAQRTEIQALRADGTLVRQSTFSGLANPRLSNTQAGAYAQDTWA